MTIGINSLHERAQPHFCRPAEFPPGTEVVDQIGITDSAATKGRDRHVVSSAKSFDFAQQGVASDDHVTASSRKLPTHQVGNFALSVNRRLWDLSNMATAESLRGHRLYDLLMSVKPVGLLEGEWAEAAGVNRGFFTDLKRTNSAPRVDTLRKLLQTVGLTEADLYQTRSGTVRTPDQLPTRSIDSGETVAITKLDLSLPMGPGATVDDYVEEEPLLFDLGYIRSFTRTPPVRLRLAHGVGDSMFPTLNTSDLVWIDSTQTMLNQTDRIWAVSINGGAAIKRLRPLKGRRVLVVSDNPSVENYEVEADELLIGGRVIRFARDL